MSTFKIGITECSKYENYRRWISTALPDIDIIRLDYHAPNVQDVAGCHGVLLSGGEDVHPSMYNKPEYIGYCYPNDISLRRDEFEWKVMQEVATRRIPVLGICRGLQFINVFFGGTLIPDVGTWGKFNHSKLPDGQDRYHNIIIDPASHLFRLTGQEELSVNSNHHQSADRIGNGLIASALAADGTVEAIERKDPDQSGWLMLVQWHPERIFNEHSHAVAPVRRSFIDAAIHFSNVSR